MGSSSNAFVCTERRKSVLRAAAYYVTKLTCLAGFTVPARNFRAAAASP
ncbi:MAG TPA: hypothetical protein VFZ34_31555 [Blastocatellia bacterium]|nr:hypothetical protein [Blastocatellia bacterium]